MGTMGARGEIEWTCLWSGGLAIPRPHLAKRQSAFVADPSSLPHVTVKIRALRPKGGYEQTGTKRIPPSRH